ncbi:fasciclin domain-containing protein [Dichotomicrobium thermohalophilum]|uniref:Putative surface protein with fasciclin (FAS1) repeats n=1 Tax=Dichotomicrobium thermohalophilum TaxID=933063 RepID=A0A397Q535_9HYPH|nr:putative surface protein with fasciclin (FAS1) repeats [Dichotomicrobium thermohalophilum]
MSVLRSIAFATIIAFVMAPAAHAGSMAKKDIVDTAKEAGSFTTLVKALDAAGLVETLKGEGPFTVFAPTDDAFGKLPEGAVEDLLKPENKDKLTAILTYHVVPGKVMSGDIKGKEMQAESVEGTQLSIDATDDVMVGDAKVTKADIEASNGVIHVIDTVLMPEGTT